MEPLADICQFYREYLIKGKRPIVFGDGEQTRDLIYVKDVVDGLMKAFNAEGADGEAFNLSTGVETSVNELLHILENKLGKPVDSEVGPPSIGDIRRMCCSNEKASRTFGFEVRYPLEVALDEYIGSLKTTSRRKT
jgi:UDP-glucose 4-epimerase